MAGRRLCALIATLVLGGCLTEFDRGLLDAARADGGAIDAGRTDASVIDGGGSDGGAGACPDVRLIEGTSVVPHVAADALPPRGEVFRDPSFGACIVRVSDGAADEIGGGVDPLERGAISSDGALAMPLIGSYRYHLYDLDARSYLGDLAIESAARAQLSPAIGDRMLRLSGAFTITERTVTGTALDTHDLGAAVTARFSDATAIDVHARSLSMDGGTMVLTVDRAVGPNRGIVVIDLATDEVIASRALTDTVPEDARVVRVGISPSGSHVVVVIAFEETGPIDRLDVYPIDLSASVFSRTDADGLGAWDVARGADGGDVLVYTERQHLWRLVLTDPIGAPVLVTDELASPAIGADRPRSNVVISGAAFDRPGWIVASFATCRISSGEPCETDAIWAMDKIVLLSIDDTPRVLNLAWHRSTTGGSRHPSAIPSRDLTRILFQSTWGAPGPDASEMFVIELPANAIGAP